MLKTKCGVPHCENKPVRGLCRTHRAQLVKARPPQANVADGAKVFSTRISDAAVAKLRAAGKGTPYRSAYLVAGRILEAMPAWEVARYLAMEDKGGT